MWRAYALFWVTLAVVWWLLRDSGGFGGLAALLLAFGATGGYYGHVEARDRRLRRSRARQEKFLRKRQRDG